MVSCDYCGAERNEWEMFHKQSGTSYCKIHSKGYRESHREVLREDDR